MQRSRRRLVLFVLFTLAALGAAAPASAGSEIANLTAAKADRVVVFKGERRMVLMHGDHVLRVYRVALGRNAIGHKVKAGDMLYFNTWGGGGWGDPLERDAELVAADVARGLVSRDGARRYGVVVADDGSVDAAATEARAGAGPPPTGDHRTGDGSRSDVSMFAMTRNGRQLQHPMSTDGLQLAMVDRSGTPPARRMARRCEAISACRRAISRAMLSKASPTFSLHSVDVSTYVRRLEEARSSARSRGTCRCSSRSLLVPTSIVTTPFEQNCSTASRLR